MRNYLKHLFLCAIWALSAISMTYASPISKSKLLDYAKEAFRQKVVANMKSPISTEPKDFFFIEERNQPLMLAMNFPQGFVLMSADDAVQPVLAYSLDENLYMELVSPATKLFIQQYKNEIRQVRSSKIQATDEVAAQWMSIKSGAPSLAKSVVVSPLISAKWNQTKYYNQYSPMDPESPSGYDSRVPNGCVAVAMSMLMHYYRYPLHGTGSHTNYSSYGDFSVNYGQQTYCYDAMPDQLGYYNNEVAKLIFHAATSVDMHYAPAGSGAYSGDVPYAMSTYFGYNPSAYFAYKSSYSGSAWRNMLKGQLNAGHPLYYSGSSEEGGHAFLCDGYDSDNLFHFNFGWGGSGNGFYTTSTSSGGNPVNGYSGWQGAAFDLYPASDDYPYQCADKLVTAVCGTLEDGSCADDYLNNMHCTYVLAPANALKFVISLDKFDTEQDADSLSFWDGNPANGNLLLSLSGGMPSSTNFTFNTDSLFITFNTNDSLTAAGWRLNYEIETSLFPCHSNMYSAPNGTLSDGSEDEPYRAHANCVWKIRIPQASWIKFSFHEFDLSPEDGLYVYDATVSPNELLRVFTGNQIPDDIVFDKSNLTVRFISDNYLSGEGFSFDWSSDMSVDAIRDFDDDVQIHPNPASNYVTLHAQTFQNPVVRIVDVAGRTVLMNEMSLENSNRLDVSLLRNGVYFVVLQEGMSLVKKKLIIAR